MQMLVVVTVVVWSWGGQRHFRSTPKNRINQVTKRNSGAGRVGQEAVYSSSRSSAPPTPPPPPKDSPLCCPRLSSSSPLTRNDQPREVENWMESMKNETFVLCSRTFDWLERSGLYKNRQQNYRRTDGRKETMGKIPTNQPTTWPPVMSSLSYIWRRLCGEQYQSIVLFSPPLTSSPTMKHQTKPLGQW